VITTLSLALAWAACVAAAGNRVSGRHPDILFPLDSPVAPASTDEPGGRRFTGRHVLTGQFRYVVDTPQRDAILQFVPDRADARRLPYFAELGHVRHVKFDNPSTFLEDVIPPATLTRLAKGELSTYTGRARIMVDGLFASVDCDQPGYTVTFVAVESIADAALANEPVPVDDGC
jgi:hypothetical protein